jgi:hypothetical protein
MNRLPLLAALIAVTALGGCATARKLTKLPPSVVVSCADRPYGFLDRRDGQSDYGCATARNLAAMAANPRDLEGGAEPGSPKGDGAFLAVERHAKGLDKPLPVVAGAAQSAGPPNQTQSK